MSGRYGVYTLFYGIVIFSMILSFVNVFVRSGLLQIAVYLLIGYAFFRVMSRNFEARRAENRWFSLLVQKLKRKRDIYRQRKADVTHIYKKCPYCKAVLRLPRRIGKHKTVCPKCSLSFEVRVKK